MADSDKQVVFRKIRGKVRPIKISRKQWHKRRAVATVGLAGALAIPAGYAYGVFNRVRFTEAGASKSFFQRKAGEALKIGKEWKQAGRGQTAEFRKLGEAAKYFIEKTQHAERVQMASMKAIKLAPKIMVAGAAAYVGAHYTLRKMRKK